MSSNLQPNATDPDFLALGVKKRTGRWARFALFISLIGIAGFVFAYYLPLYRAHDALTTEFEQLASEDKDKGTKLKTALGALERARSERTKLEQAEFSRSRKRKARAQKLEQFEWAVSSEAKPYTGKKWLSVERDAKELRVDVLSAALFSPDLSDLRSSGRRVLCAAVSQLRMNADARIEVRAFSGEREISKPTVRAESAWQLAATRSGAAARALVEDCGLDASRVRAAAALSESEDAPLLQIAVHPKPADDAAEGSQNEAEENDGVAANDDSATAEVEAGTAK